ncbi:MAG: hypothetical protein E7453_03795 [Ruminococcaceae bacterium]|nr:hypothetical protein [Oscillospiraceae bacterium]
MKKVSFIFILCLLLALAGCGTSYQEDVWYSEEKLAECLVPELPQTGPTLLNQSDWRVYDFLTNEEFQTYVQSVYNYLKAQNFQYLGTRGHYKSSLSIAFMSYYFQPAETLAQHCQNGDYYFVYSDGTTDEGGQLVFWFLGIHRATGASHSYDGKNYKYNTQLTLRKGGEAPATGFYYYDEEHIDPCFFAHSYDKGCVYPVPGTEQTVTIRSCVNCGHEDYEPFTGNGHSYQITVTEGSELIVCLPETHPAGAFPEKYASGILMKLYTNKVMDADIAVTVNGTNIQSQEVGNYWCYAFIVPNCDVEISLDIVGGI